MTGHRCNDLLNTEVTKDARPLDDQAPVPHLISRTDRPSTEVPVVFLVFNRPRTTYRVFEAIRAAKPRHLMIIADGPRHGRPDDVAGCAAVRSIVERVDWDCRLETNFADANLGIARRYASGLKWAFDRVDETIILEDDCLPHPSFFPYCASLLERYRHDPRVIWVGGTNPYPEPRGDGSYFFSRINWAWGWATWKRAWQDFDPMLTRLPDFVRAQRIKALTPHRIMQNGFLAMFELAHEGSWGTNWDIRATFNIWWQNGLVIHPNGNLITNIGFGNDAKNTKSPNDPLAALPFRPIGPLVHPSSIYPDTQYDRDLFDQYMNFADQMGRFRKYRKMPGYGIARSLYRALAKKWITNAGRELYSRR
jgi:hypothetical protein